jgi:hypothetical protein
MLPLPVKLITGISVENAVAMRAYEPHLAQVHSTVKTPDRRGRGDFFGMLSGFLGQLCNLVRLQGYHLRLVDYVTDVAWRWDDVYFYRFKRDVETLLRGNCLVVN